ASGRREAGGSRAAAHGRRRSCHGPACVHGNARLSGADACHCVGLGPASPRQQTYPAGLRRTSDGTPDCPLRNVSCSSTGARAASTRNTPSPPRAAEDEAACTGTGARMKRNAILILLVAACAPAD